MFKVSLCIPAYRQVSYLRRALLSIKSQTFQDYEIIVTDDSPDESVKDLLSEFEFSQQLTYIKNINPLGSPENWNKCISLAKGEYIKILHHDDHFIRPDSLQAFVELLDSNPLADFGFCASQVEHVDSGLLRVHKPTQLNLQSLRQSPDSLFAGNFIGAPSATIHRNGIGLKYDNKMKWLVDVDYYYRLLMKNNHFAFTSEALICTPTNAPHQVTELCRDNKSVEIGEAMLFFQKLSLAQQESDLVKHTWIMLFRRFRMRKIDDFKELGIVINDDKLKYFDCLLKIPHTYWERLMNPVLLSKGIFYRLYPHVPSPIRFVLKKLYHQFKPFFHGK